MNDARLPLGVLGGLGPAATVCFLDKVVELTDAASDQEHLDFVVLNRATTPDRTAFVLGNSTDDPTPIMSADAERLASWGVEFIVLPCNTAHHFVEKVEQAAAPVPILSIVEATVEEAVRRKPGLASVGILATEGTISAEVYQHAFEARGVSTVIPDEANQARITSVIYDQVKAGLPGDLNELVEVAEGLLKRGAELVVLGCTELSVVAAGTTLLQDPTYVDSLDVLARTAITRAGGRVRRN